MEVTMTKEVAIEMGYTHCGTKDGEYITKIDTLNELDLESEYYVCDKEHSSPTIDDEWLAEMIAETLYGQEEFYDESDSIQLKASEVLDRLKVSDELNKAFSDLKYYHVTAIKLVK